MKLIDEKNSHAPIPRIFIDFLALQKIKYFTAKSLYEINGLGTVEKIGNDFLIADIFLIKQISLGPLLAVKFDQKAHSLFLYEWVKKNGNADSLKFQWHSHAHAPAFFSLEDLDTIKGYMSDLMISLVINKNGEYECRLDLYNPFHLSLGMELFVKMPSLSATIAENCFAEMEDKVKIKTFNLVKNILDPSQENGEIVNPISNFLNKTEGEDVYGL